MRGTLCTDSRLCTCMALRDANYNIVCVNVLHIFHCTAPGDNNYIAFYIKGNSQSCTVHNLHNHKGQPWTYLLLKFVSSKMDPTLE